VLEAISSVPRLREQSPDVLHGLAVLNWMTFERGRRHETVPDAFSVHHLELEDLFGRDAFVQLNQALGVVHMVGQAAPGLTRAYRWADDVEDQVVTRLRAANAAGHSLEMISRDGTISRRSRLPAAIKRESLSARSIWHSSKIRLAVPVDVVGLARLDDLLAIIEALTSSERAAWMAALELEPDTNIEVLRSYLLAVRRRACDELPGRGLIVGEYEQVDTGRLFEIGPGLQGAAKIIKRFALAGRWAHDIECCHPSIVVQLAARQGLTCDAISDYVANKDDWLKTIAERTRLSRKQVKTGLYAIGYGSRQRFDGVEDAVTTELGTHAAGALFADRQVKSFMRDLMRAGKAIEAAWPRTRGGFLVNVACCAYSGRSRKLEGKKDTWSARLAHLVQGYEVLALHSVVTAFPDEVLVLEHDGWTSRGKMDKTAIERVIGDRTGLKLAVKSELIQPPSVDCLGAE